MKYIPTHIQILDYLLILIYIFSGQLVLFRDTQLGNTFSVTSIELYCLNYSKKIVFNSNKNDLCHQKASKKPYIKLLTVFFILQIIFQLLRFKM